MWRSFFDVIFSGSSVLLAIFFGAALGNVVRGVPLGTDGYFFEPLWTDWRVGPQPGILDWYTVMAGVVALVTLTMHGAVYIATKTAGELNARARRIAGICWPLLLAMTFVSLVLTIWIKPDADDNFRQHPVGLIIPVLVFVALAGMWRFHRNGNDKGAFLASCLYIAGMLGGAAFALYPYVLPASTDPSLGLTIYNTAAGRHGLTVGLVWWTLGMILALGYFVFIYRMFRGKVAVEGEGHY